MLVTLWSYKPKFLRPKYSSGLINRGIYREKGEGGGLFHILKHCFCFIIVFFGMDYLIKDI